MPTPSFVAPSVASDVLLRPSAQTEVAAATRHEAARPWRMTALLMAGDTLALGVLLYVLHIASLWVAPAFAPMVMSAAPIAVGSVLSLYVGMGLYRTRVMHPVEELRSIAVPVTGLALIAPGFTYMMAGSPVAVGLVAATGALAVVVVPLARITTRIMGAHLPWWGVPAVVVGSTSATARIVDTMKRWPEIGLRPVAVCEAGTGQHGTRTGSSPEALHWARQHQVPYAILAEEAVPADQRAHTLAHYSQFFEHVFCVPATDGMVATWTTTATCDGLYGFGVRHLQHQTAARFMKRALDVVGAASLLIMLLPVFAAIALAIRYASPGPVFYRQTRMGYQGRTFTVFKFRTMYTDADTRLDDLLARNPRCRAEYEQYHKLHNDPRVTSVGQWLRRYSLDELPQLLNVLRGDMSLVGPRAYMPKELFQMRGLSRVVLQTPPGITGLWQVSGRNAVSFSSRVDLDVHYVHNWSPWLDLYLLARTLPVVCTGRGAH
ncbi:undecaprenyl-phosphate galactose phosphotransferase WbaP [Longimonas halophila]|nr:undecaprenyl-phosphate galactose phosphotransferase WbaP [Longimonas halophila]